jgi:hypothetical protein
MESDLPQTRADPDYTLESFTEGAPVPVDRFTKEAVQRWVSQPTWKVIKR